ncbi:hypothetical protein JW711_02215 [Candidatus Woesearchaeota archaeon]|nr:hypothetical protein [Candidatus Woesearchaeota archaeon]
MLFGQKPLEENEQPPEEFAFTSQFIDEELGLERQQKENLVVVSNELEEALTRSEGLKKLIKMMREADKIMLKNLEEKDREQVSTTGLIKEIRLLISNQKLEDLERLMSRIHKQSQTKIHLSQNELNDLRQLMIKLNNFYQEASGLCRLIQLMYSQLEKAYSTCQDELEKEMMEEEELSQAGSGGTRPLQGSKTEKVVVQSTIR